MHFSPKKPPCRHHPPSCSRISETVEWGPNFDNTLREPLVLHRRCNLIINGSTGIAVGMATNIPPHNLGEVVDAAAYMIDHFDNLEDVHTTDLLQFVKGPRTFPRAALLPLPR